MLFVVSRGAERKRPGNCQDGFWISGISDSGFVQIQQWVVVTSPSDCRSIPPHTQLREGSEVQFFKL